MQKHILRNYYKEIPCNMLTMTTMMMFMIFGFLLFMTFPFFLASLKNERQINSSSQSYNVRRIFILLQEGLIIGKNEEQLPQKTVGRLLANSRTTVDRQSDDSRPTVDRQSANCWPTVGRLSCNCWPTVGRLSADCRSR